MSEYIEHITFVEDMKTKINDFALEMYNKGKVDAIDELIELMKPCNNCPSYPNECNHIDYFEDCCRTEHSISLEDLRLKAEQLKSHK